MDYVEFNSSLSNISSSLGNVDSAGAMRPREENIICNFFVGAGRSFDIPTRKTLSLKYLKEFQLSFIIIWIINKL